MIESVDFSQWPAWAIVLLLIINTFKSPLSNLFKAKSHIKEIEAEGQRQDEVAEKLMLASFAQQSLDHNRELIDFLKTVVVSRMDAMNKRLENMANDYNAMQIELRKLTGK